MEFFHLPITIFSSISVLLLLLIFLLLSQNYNFKFHTPLNSTHLHRQFPPISDQFRALHFPQTAPSRVTLVRNISKKTNMINMCVYGINDACK